MRPLHGSGHPACWRASVLVLAVVLLAGCQDTPTNLPTASSHRPALLSSALGRGRAPGLVRYACLLQRRDPASPAFWQMRTDSMAFPQGELNSGEQTVVYRFRSVTAKGALEFAASCVVPYTERALHRVDQRFGAGTGGGADQFKARQGGMATQGCVQDGGACQLQAVDVIVTGCANPDWTRGEDGVCRSSRDGTGDGSGSGGGDWGGSTGDPPPPEPEEDPGCSVDDYGTACESIERPECQRPFLGADTCVTRDPSEPEWTRLGEIINRMTTGTEYCQGAKAQAQGMYADGRINGRIRLWDGRNYIAGTNQTRMKWGQPNSDARGRIMELDSYLAFASRSLVAHEALHAYLNSISSPMTHDEREDWILAHERECAG
jgi:hypothetical protein